MDRRQWEEDLLYLQAEAERLQQEVEDGAATPGMFRHLEGLRNKLRWKETCAREYGKFPWMEDEVPDCGRVLERALDTGQKVGSLDTEYYVHGGGGVYATEVGISVLRPGYLASTRHFALDGGKPMAQKFLYGKTERYNSRSPNLRAILRQCVQDLDLILVWGGHQDVRAMRNLGVEVPAEKVLDLSFWKRWYSEEGLKMYNLEEFCWIQGLRHKLPHCAGNDSHMLLEASLHAIGLLGEDFELEPLNQ